jgi:hypothetical protein
MPTPRAAPRRGRWAILAAAVGALVAAIAVAVAVAIWWRGPDPANSAATDLSAQPMPTAPANDALNVQLRVYVWRKEDKTSKLELQDPAAVPLRAEDLVRIEASATRPAYLYLVNIESTGKVQPVYPWRGQDWQKRREERPMRSLNVPDSPTGAVPLRGSPDGTESFVLLARDRPLSADENDRLAAAFQRNQGPDKAPALAGAAIFHGGDPNIEFAAAKDRATRGFIDASAGANSDDVVQRLQQLLADELKPLVSDSVAVCYPFRQK